MNRVLTLAAVAVLTTGSAAFAATQADIDADQRAIAKDKVAIAKQNANIQHNRAEKEDAKAKGDTLGQAGESVTIGANQSVKALKEGEKAVDKEILDHHKGQTN